MDLSYSAIGHVQEFHQERSACLIAIFMNLRIWKIGSIWYFLSYLNVANYIGLGVCCVVYGHVSCGCVVSVYPDGILLLRWDGRRQSRTRGRLSCIWHGRYMYSVLFLYCMKCFSTFREHFIWYYCSYWYDRYFFYFLFVSAIIQHFRSIIRNVC